MTDKPLEHVDSVDCWCEPEVYAPCSECDPFEIEHFQDDPEDAEPPRFTAEQNRKLAIIGAAAVHIPVPGATARRPRRSKGCWKCGGDGLLKLAPDEPREHGFVFHHS